MIRSLRRLAAAASIPLLLAGAPARAADEVVVLTSYPEEMTTLYEQAFERAVPGAHIRIVWQQGRDAMQTLHKPNHGDIDVYWAPAAYNFPTLAQEGAFQLVRVDRSVLPGRIGVQSVSDAKGRFEAFEVAGYGLAVNPAVLTAKNAALPSAWDDLAKPAYDGLVVMPVPSAIGFAPTLYDIILQSKGWADGWALLSEMSANAQLAQKGSTILGPVLDGKTGVALAIDFLIRNAIAEGQPLKLVYPRRTAFLPAYVGVIAGAPHGDAARRFVSFVLSKEGQELLFNRDVNRYPIRPAVYAAGPANIVNPFDIPKEATFDYDQTIGPPRAPLIASLFDAAVASRQERLRTLWRAIHAAEKNGASAATREARALAGWVPVSAEDADNEQFIAAIAKPHPGQPDARAREWAAAMDEKQTRALALVSK